MKHLIQHELPPEMIKKVAVQAAERYTQKLEKYNAKVDWTSDTHASITFQVKGIRAMATLDLQPGQVEADMNVPLLLRPFKKLAISKIDETFQQWIEKARSAKLD